MKCQTSYICDSVSVCDLLPYRRAMNGHYQGSKVNENVH